MDVPFNISSAKNKMSQKIEMRLQKIIGPIVRLRQAFSQITSINLWQRCLTILKMLRSLALHRGFKWQKSAKNYIRNFVKLSGSDLCLQWFDKFLKCSACNHWKQKLWKSAESIFGKIGESTSTELIFGGFYVIWNLCALLLL